MKSLRVKLIIGFIVFAVAMLVTGISVYGTNENIEIVQKSSSSYLIYISGNEKTNFEFAFSNVEGVEPSPSSYKPIGTDGAGDNIAYIDSSTIGMFSSSVYMWARIVGTTNYIEENKEINLSQAILDTDLQFAANVTKKIPVSIDTTTTENIVDGATVTLTVGKIVIENPVGTYEYQIVPLTDTTLLKIAEYNNFMSLATAIYEFPKSTNITMMQKIETYNTFKSVYDSLQPTAADANWILAENNEIPQPIDAKSGDNYIVWIKQTNNGVVTIDAQFMTSTRDYNAKTTRDLITGLPVTGDDYTLLMTFGILAAASIIVYIVIRRLENKK